jgi:sulfite exporter TauE/SafE/copper chaperone CopZ
METTEKQDLQKRSFRIGGMYCAHCQYTIEKGLKNTAGVQNAAVNYNTGTAVVTYDTSVINFDKISSVIESLGYKTLEENDKTVSHNNTITQIIGTLVIVFSLFLLLRAFTTSNMAAIFPLAQEGMGYGMLLIIGLLTSVHCVAMCGGINISQTLKERNAPVNTANTQTAFSKSSFNFALLLPGILYNGGRLISYTLVGIIVGVLGSVITVSGRFQGVVQLIAGIFMGIMGINMLGLFPSLRRFIPQMPSLFTKKIDERKVGSGPLIIGFLNGFMPCGPLQAMQLYALSTGSPVRGGISMFLFCVGTIPLMFALGTASSALSGAKGRAFSRRVVQIGAVLIAALGFVMFSNGWNLLGFSIPGFANKPASAPEGTAPLARRQIQNAPSPANDNARNISPTVPVIENGMQIVKSTLQPNRYPAITVQQGIPVRWTINAPPGSITGCNYTVIFNEYGIEYVFKQGNNVIEFTPKEAGRFRYSCWMGMIKSTITVLAESEKEVK